MLICLDGSLHFILPFGIRVGREGKSHSPNLWQKSGYPEENVKLTRDYVCRWEKDEEERRVKEEGKREKIALATWRKLLMGLRIIERVREEYGGDADAHIVEETNPFTNPGKANKSLQADVGRAANKFSYTDGKEDITGGFVSNDYDPDGGGFLAEDHGIRRRAGELTIEDEIGPIHKRPLNAPTSMDSNIVKYRSPITDVSKGATTEADLDKNTDPEKAGTIISGPISSNSRKRRAAPTSKATRTSERVSKNHFLDHPGEEDDKSSKPKRKRNKRGPIT